MTLREGLQNALKAKGLGTAIREITSAVGIRPCTGCKKRAEWLDKNFPFRQVTRQNMVNKNIG